MTREALRNPECLSFRKPVRAHSLGGGSPLLALLAPGAVGANFTY